EREREQGSEKSSHERTSCGLRAHFGEGRASRGPGRNQESRIRNRECKTRAQQAASSILDSRFLIPDSPPSSPEDGSAHLRPRVEAARRGEAAEGVVRQVAFAGGLGEALELLDQAGEPLLVGPAAEAAAEGREAGAEDERQVEVP